MGYKLWAAESASLGENPPRDMWLLLLTETLGVSATPAREAIKRLQAEHALVVGSNRTHSVPVLT